MMEWKTAATRCGVALVVLGLVPILSPKATRAQEGGTPLTLDQALERAQGSTVLTLDAALERAQQNNPDYRKALNNLELNRLDSHSAWEAFLPSLSLSWGTNLGFNRQLVGTDDFGNPVPNPETKWVTSSGSSQGVSLNLPLFQWGGRFQGLSAQRAGARAREASVRAQLRTMEASVIRAYRDAQNQQALLTAEEGLLENRNLDLQRTQRMFELAGAATRVDVLAAELEVQRQEQNIQAARASLQAALLRLRTAIGDQEMSDFQVVAEDLPQPFDPSGLDPDSLVRIALASNPSVLGQEASLAQSRAQAQKARADRWPDLGIGFSFRQSTGSRDRSSLFDFYPRDSRGGSAGFSISIPLFPRFSQGDAVARAEITETNAEEDLRAQRMRTEQDVRSRLISLVTAYQTYQIAVRSQEIAQERLQLGQEQFRLGSRTFTELQQDVAAAAQAERGLVTQLFSFLRAQVDLEETVGVKLGPGGAEPGEG